MTNRRPEARTVLPGDRLLYISRKCPSPSDIQTHLQEAQYKEPRRPDGGCHQLDAVRPDEEEDWQSVIDEDEDPAFYSDDKDGGEEIWSDGESRGEPGVRSQMSLAATSESESDPCTEAPAFQRATRDKREREAERAASPIPAPSPSPSPSPLPSPPPSPLLFPLDAWIPELESMNETGSLPDLGCTHRPSPTPLEPVWPTELDIDEDCPMPAPSPS